MGGEINLKEVVSVRVSPVKSTKNGQDRGIDLESGLSGKVWTIVPEGEESIFDGWLTMLRETVKKQNRELYDQTGDVELQKDVKDIKSSEMSNRSKNVMRENMIDEDEDVDDGIEWEIDTKDDKNDVSESMTNIDAYNVDVREAMMEDEDVEKDVSGGLYEENPDVSLRMKKILETREALLLSGSTIGMKSKRNLSLKYV